MSTSNPKATAERAKAQWDEYSRQYTEMTMQYDRVFQETGTKRKFIDDGSKNVEGGSADKTDHKRATEPAHWMQRVQINCTNGKCEGGAAMFMGTNLGNIFLPSGPSITFNVKNEEAKDGGLQVCGPLSPASIVKLHRSHGKEKVEVKEEELDDEEELNDEEELDDEDSD